MPRPKTLAGIDVGTTKICVCIAEVADDGITVLGTGVCRSEGLQKGVVVNLTRTVNAVKAAIERAEREAGHTVESVWVSAGSHFIKGANTQVQTEIRGRNGKVCAEDLQRILELARRFELPPDYQLLHTLPQCYSLDQQEGVQDPLGMRGSRLTAHLHLVINANAVVENIINSINQAGVLVTEVVMQQLASSEAVLTPDEKELGCVLVDVGGGTTDIAVFNRNRIWHSEVIPLGGSLITKDVAIGLRAPLEEAESLKIRAGTVYPDSVAEEEVIEVREMGTGRLQAFSRRELCKIIEARCDEIILAIAHALRRAEVEPDLSCGIVMTGGGALMDGLIERTAEQLRMPVRLGRPLDYGERSEVSHPSYSTALGLLRFAAQRHRTPGPEAATSQGFWAGPKALADWFKRIFVERI